MTGGNGWPEETHPLAGTELGCGSLTLHLADTTAGSGQVCDQTGGQAMQTQTYGATTSTRANGTSLISGKSVQGTRVYSPAGEDLGHIDDVMVDTSSGKIVYGVLEFGGFLGIGSDHHAIPFGKLNYDTSREGYVTDLTKEQLENAPRQDETWRENRDWQQRSHEYYGVAPYWL